MGSPERRSPTPEGAVPLSERVRTSSGWDIRPAGYETMGAMEAKQTGLSPSLPVAVCNLLASVADL
jgi:splicing factor U2AF subunit